MITLNQVEQFVLDSYKNFLELPVEMTDQEKDGARMMTNFLTDQIKEAKKVEGKNV